MTHEGFGASHFAIFTLMFIAQVANFVDSIVCNEYSDHIHVSNAAQQVEIIFELCCARFYFHVGFMNVKFVNDGYLVSGYCGGRSFGLSASSLQGSSTYSGCGTSSFTLTHTTTYSNCFRMTQQFSMSDSSSAVTSSVTITALGNLTNFQYARFVTPIAATINRRGLTRGRTWHCDSRKCATALLASGWYLGLVFNSLTNCWSNAAILSTVGTAAVMQGTYQGNGVKNIAIGVQSSSTSSGSSIAFTFAFVQSASLSGFIAMSLHPSDGAGSTTCSQSGSSELSLSQSRPSQTSTFSRSASVSSSRTKTTASMSASFSSTRSITTVLSASSAQSNTKSDSQSRKTRSRSLLATSSMSGSSSRSHTRTTVSSESSTQSNARTHSPSRNTRSSLLSLTTALTLSFTFTRSDSRSSNQSSRTVSFSDSPSLSPSSSWSPTATASNSRDTVTNTASPRRSHTVSLAHSDSSTQSSLKSSSQSRDTRSLGATMSHVTLLASTSWSLTTASDSISGSSTASSVRLTQLSSASASRSLSSSGCDDVPWFIEVVMSNSDNSTTVGQSIVGALSSPREVTVSYDWFVANHTALVLRFASLSPWRIRGAHLLLGGEELAVDVSDVDTSLRGNATVRLSPLPNSTLMAGGGYVWPGVRRTPYVDQTVVVELDLRCSAVLAGGAAFTVVVRGLPLPSVAAMAQAVVSSSQALSAMSGSPASASTMARVSAAMSVASCAQAIDSSSVAQSTDKVKSLFPIQFYNSSSPNDDIVNSLLANYIFVAAFATVVVLIALCVSLAAHVTVREVLLHLRWPSVLFPAIVATLPSGVGTIGAFLTRATTSALLPEDWAPCLIACATGAVMWLGFCVWVTVVCVRGSWLLEPQLKEEEVTFVDKLKRCDTSWFRDFLRIVFRSQWMWAPAVAPNSASGAPAKAELDSEKALFDEFLSSNASVFTELRVTWFTSLDVWVTLVSSVANAIPLTSVRGCVSVAATNVVLALILLVIAAAARPFGSRFGTVQLLLMQIGAFVCACCVFAYIIIASELLLTVVSYAVLLVGVVSMSRTVVDLFELFNVAVRLRLLIRSLRFGEEAVHCTELRSVEIDEQELDIWDGADQSPLGVRTDVQVSDKESVESSDVCAGATRDPHLGFAVLGPEREVDDTDNFDALFWDESGNFASCGGCPPSLRQKRRLYKASLFAMFSCSDDSDSLPPSKCIAPSVSYSLDNLDIDDLLNGGVPPGAADCTTAPPFPGASCLPSCEYAECDSMVEITVDECSAKGSDFSPFAAPHSINVMEDLLPCIDIDVVDTTVMTEPIDVQNVIADDTVRHFDDNAVHAVDAIISNELAEALADRYESPVACDEELFTSEGLFTSLLDACRDINVPPQQLNARGPLLDWLRRDASSVLPKAPPMAQPASQGRGIVKGTRALRPEVDCVSRNITSRGLAVARQDDSDSLEWEP